MTTSATTRYTINGVLDTKNPVMTNLQNLCKSSGVWLTFDNQTGQWSVVINKSESSIHSFNNSNIIGPLSVSGSGIYDLYNSVKVTYPHEDLKGSKDFIQVSLPSIDRYPNEPDNTMEITLDLVTNPVQAELLGYMALKQSRADKLITFQTDYSKIGVKAGDVIDITSDVYGFVAKKFRVQTVREVDSDAGGLNLELTVFEYDETVYTEDLSRYERSSNNGILSIGSIDAPLTPTVTKYEVTSRPRIEATTQIQGGIVDTVELWLSTDTGVSEGSRNYYLMQSQHPINGSTFLTSDIILFDISSLGASNFVVKCRAKNSNSTSPFSSPSGIIAYVPIQVPNAITDNTAVTQANGSPISGMLTAATLLGLTNGLMKGNSSPFSLFGNIFGLFESITGANLLQTFANSSVTSAQINADYIVITYTFTDGVDLDSRTNIEVPNYNQSTPANYIGYSDSGAGHYGTGDTSVTYWPASGATSILTWGGDNTGTGVESVLIDLVHFRTYNPDTTVLKIRTGAYWYGNPATPGSNPVRVDAQLYKGGTPSKTGFQWSVSGYTETKSLGSSASRVYDSGYTYPRAGDYLGTLVYNFANQTGTFEY